MPQPALLFPPKDTLALLRVGGWQVLFAVIKVTCLFPACSSWAIRCQRSARVSASPLQQPRTSRWGSQSNLLSLEVDGHGTVDMQQQLAASEQCKASSSIKIPFSSKAAGKPQAVPPEVDADTNLQQDGTTESVGLLKECADSGLVLEPNSKQLSQDASGAAVNTRSTHRGILHHGSSNGASPATMDVAEQTSAPRNCKPAMRGQGDAFAKPLQALINTVAKVGIKPAAGTLLSPSLAPRRSKRVPGNNLAPDLLPRSTPLPVKAPSQTPVVKMTEQVLLQQAHAEAEMPESGTAYTEPQAATSDAIPPPEGLKGGDRGVGDPLPGGSPSVLRASPGLQSQQASEQQILTGVKRMRRTPSALRNSGTLAHLKSKFKTVG